MLSCYIHELNDAVHIYLLRYCHYHILDDAAELERLIEIKYYSKDSMLTFRPNLKKKNQDGG